VNQFEPLSGDIKLIHYKPIIPPLPDLASWDENVQTSVDRLSKIKAETVQE
jgi:hypothetical protein